MGKKYLFVRNFIFTQIETKQGKSFLKVFQGELTVNHENMSVWVGSHGLLCAPIVFWGAGLWRPELGFLPSGPGGEQANWGVCG